MTRPGKLFVKDEGGSIEALSYLQYIILALVFMICTLLAVACVWKQDEKQSSTMNAPPNSSKLMVFLVGRQALYVDGEL